MCVQLENGQNPLKLLLLLQVGGHVFQVQHGNFVWRVKITYSSDAILWLSAAKSEKHLKSHPLAVS